MKKFFALVALVTLAFTACNNEPTNEFSATIKPESTLVEFGKSGGEKTVKFAIINPVGGSVTTEDNADWIEAAVEFNSELIITAEANPGDAREAKVTLKYSSAKSVNIVVKQRSGLTGDYDVEYVAEHFEGQYYGNKESTNYNYFVILSDFGLTVGGQPKADGTYYYFDFYSKVAGDEEYPVLPNGTYTFDKRDTFADATFSDISSWYVVYENGKVKTSKSYKSATVTVADNKFEAIIEMTDGEMHKVSYEGDLYVGSDNILSTFTKDITFDIEGAEITATNYGDTQQMGLQTWFIEAVKGDELFMLEFFAASSETPAGIYNHFAGTSGENYENKFISGFIGEDGLVGSWYAKLTDNTIKGDVMAPLSSGMIRITTEGNAMTIELGCKDDAGNEITGSVKGNIK
jgi:hypothetical protein